MSKPKGHKRGCRCAVCKARRNASRPSSERKKKWIKGAVKRPGALHRKLGIPKGKRIPTTLIKSEIAKLKRKRAANGKLNKADERFRKQLQFALNVRSRASRTSSGRKRRRNAKTFTAENVADYYYGITTAPHSLAATARHFGTTVYQVKKILGLQGTKSIAQRKAAATKKRRKLAKGKKKRANPSRKPAKRGSSPRQVAARTVSSMAARTRAAVRARLRGDIQTALVKEAEVDDLLVQLRDYARRHRIGEREWVARAEAAIQQAYEGGL